MRTYSYTIVRLSIWDFFLSKLSEKTTAKHETQLVVVVADEKSKRKIARIF